MAFLFFPILPYPYTMRYFLFYKNDKISSFYKNFTWFGVEKSIYKCYHNQGFKSTIIKIWVMEVKFMDSNDSFGRSRHLNTDAFFTGKIIGFTGKWILPIHDVSSTGRCFFCAWIYKTVYLSPFLLCISAAWCSFCCTWWLHTRKGEFIWTRNI